MDATIEARIAALEAELSELKKAVAAGDAGPPTSDRRGMIKLVAATAAGAMTGAALLGPEPAAAADEAVLLGKANSGMFATGIEATDFSALYATSQKGVGVVAEGTTGNAWFPGGDKSPPTRTTGAGVVWVDSAGDWWASIDESEFVGHWRKLAGPNTAGQLHILPNPLRVYDSRPGQAPTLVLPKSRTAANEIRVIQPTFRLPPEGVPSAARAVMITLTITGPQTAGFAAAWATGPWPGTSTINFAAGQDIATTTVVGCRPTDATIQIMSSTVTDFLVDVIGYYQ